MFEFAEVTKDMTASEILNYYRNLYYAEPQVTERGIVANAINDFFTDVVPKSKYDRLKKLFNDMTQEAKGYLNRLYGIRADDAREIFADIEKVIGEKYESYVFDDIEMKDWEQDAIVAFADTMSEHFAELKKKYTEGNHDEQIR